MTSQEKWITSGASRLKARQNRGFIFRAKQKASNLGMGVLQTRKRQTVNGGRTHASTRRRIVIGKEAVAKAHYPRDYTQPDHLATESLVLVPSIAEDHMPHHGARGARRIREVPSTLHPTSQFLVGIQQHCPTISNTGGTNAGSLVQARPSGGILFRESGELLLSKASAVESIDRLGVPCYPPQQWSKSLGTMRNDFELPSTLPFVPHGPRELSMNCLERGSLSAQSSLTCHESHQSVDEGLHHLRQLREKAFDAAVLDISEHSLGPRPCSARFKPSRVPSAHTCGSQTVWSFVNKQQSKVICKRKEAGADVFKSDVYGNDNYGTCAVVEPNSSMNEEHCKAGTEDDASKVQSPVRFFDAGVEISLNGRPLCLGNNTLTTSNSSMALSNDIEVNSTNAHSERDKTLKDLHERQQSIWDLFSCDRKRDANLLMFS